MATTIQSLVPAKQITNTQTTQYTATAIQTAVIDKATITNTTALNASISINLVPLAGTLNDTNLILDSKTIGAGETYTSYELTGQVIDGGGIISTLSDTDLALTLKINGRVIT